MIKEAVELSTVTNDLLTAITEAHDLLNNVESIVDTYEAAFNAVFGVPTLDAISTLPADAKSIDPYNNDPIREINWW